MARAVIVCHRRAVPGPEGDRRAHVWDVVGKRLSGPESRLPMRVVRPDPQTEIACMAVTPLVRISQKGLAVGYLDIASTSEYPWDSVGTPTPDGTFALFRTDAGSVEVATDALATRTVWLYHDDEMFVASTSQRAIIMLLGSFSFDRRVVPWFLANGCTGPTGGWDRRISRLSGGEIATLDRRAWSLQRSPARPEVSRTIAKRGNPRMRFAAEVRAIMERLQVDGGQWMLPLSAGYDSRLLACHLAGRSGIPAVTWGVAADASAEEEAGTAAAVASWLGLSHSWHPVVCKPGTERETIECFVAMSEGRTDNVMCYVDGFKSWNRFAGQNIGGVIRGDEAFGGAGWGPLRNARQVRESLGFQLLCDNASTRWMGAFPSMRQEVPADFDRGADETVEAWRLRLFHKYRVSTALAALTETEAAWVDAVKPLQFRAICDLVLALPGRWRRDKAVLVDTVKRFGPSVAFGGAREGDQMREFLRSPEMGAWLADTLGQIRKGPALPPELVDGLISRIPSTGQGAPARPSRAIRLRWWVQANIPAALKRRIKPFLPPVPTDDALLAFRACIVGIAHDLFLQDARVLAETNATRASVEVVETGAQSA